MSQFCCYCKTQTLTGISVKYKGEFKLSESHDLSMQSGEFGKQTIWYTGIRIF